MRGIVLISVAIVLMVVPSQAKQKHRVPRQYARHSRSVAKRTIGGWDPGYTYSNPYGLPRWVRRRPR